MNAPSLTNDVLAAAALLSLVLTRSMIALAHRNQWVVKPKADRWHKTPTALYGGVAICLTFLIGSLALAGLWKAQAHGSLYALLAGGLILFLVGVRDDVRPLNPVVKMLGQLAAIMPFLVGLAMEAPAPIYLLGLPALLFSMLALINALNLLDNMDGLSAGTAATIGTTLAVYAGATGQNLVAALSALLAVSCLGFLFFNFRRKEAARIFMGDCGSLFLGFMISGLLILAVYTPASNLTTMLTLAPMLVMVPIFDTTLVVVRRKREGRSISQGGKDHSSHRLVYAGFGEKGSILTLHGLSLVLGLIGVALALAKIPGLQIGALALTTVGMIKFGNYLSRFSQPAAAPTLAVVSTNVAVSHPVGQTSVSQTTPHRSESRRKVSDSGKLDRSKIPANIS